MMLLAMCFSFQYPCKERDMILTALSALTLIPGELGTSQERGMEKTWGEDGRDGGDLGTQREGQRGL